MRELIGNTLYNFHRDKSDEMFPSTCLPEMPKSSVKRKAGRPSKTQEQRETEHVSSGSMAQLERIEKQVKQEYRHVQVKPTFTFNAAGLVTMPIPPGPPPKKSKKRKGQQDQDDESASQGPPTNPGASGALQPSSRNNTQTSQAVTVRTAKRKKILPPARSESGDENDLQADAPMPPKRKTGGTDSSSLGRNNIRGESALDSHNRRADKGKGKALSEDDPLLIDYEHDFADDESAEDPQKASCDEEDLDEEEDIEGGESTSAEGETQSGSENGEVFAGSSKGADDSEDTERQHRHEDSGAEGQRFDKSVGKGRLVRLKGLHRRQ